MKELVGRVWVEKAEALFEGLARFAGGVGNNPGPNHFFGYG
jgi:hypothetical protein